VNEQSSTNGSGLPTAEPSPTLETEPFWDAADSGRLVLPRCDACDTVIWYPRLFCPHCHGNEITWIEASGRGTVYSYTVVRKSMGEWKDVVPYVLAYVELDEGPRVLTNVVGCDPDAVEVGQPVEVTFDRSSEGRGVPRFRPTAARSPVADRATFGR
jgi:uncharacterized protein